ncbi:hypothetical protein HY992_06710 [Candidatus Micrarchaeota archaeon]|nr:hypothetical protein [Candidatus Micrarchaeota archaeon]
MQVIEHFPKQVHAQTIEMLARALASGGVLIVSTPNKGVITYLEKDHVGEMTLAEFDGLMKEFFQEVEIYATSIYEKTPLKIMLKAIREAMVKLRIYETICSLTPPTIIGRFSQLMRKNTLFKRMEELERNEVPLNLIAVARKPRETSERV